MAAPSNAERSPEPSAPLKAPKTEAPSPDSEDLSDGNPYHSNSSTPSRFSPLNVGVSAPGAAGRSGAASAASNSFTVCRGMSWTPSETNALIAVWGNERLAEARMQQLEVAGTVFSGKAPGPAMYERVSRALAELGYERTPSQCRERMKEMESDGSTMEDYPQEDWCNQDLSAVFQEGEIEAGKRQDLMQNVVRILESVEVKWEHFQTWTDFSRLHLSNKLAIFGVGYNTRWREEIRYHYAEISSQVPLGKRLREYFNPEKTEGRVIMTKVQKMNWKNVYYKFLDITISEARCLELHMEVDWIYIAQTSASGCSNGSQYLLPGGIPKTYGLYAIGYEERTGTSTSSREDNGSSSGEIETDRGEKRRNRTSAKVTYCYLGIAEDRTLQQCLVQHFQSSGKHCTRGEPSAITRFLQENCSVRPKDEDSSSSLPMYIKFIEVELDFLSAGSLVECLEIAIGYPLKFNKKDSL
ncbi:myb/SANT-like DNA-binding domain-containing protein 2 [Astyanax mexicanus]|uniref:Myb/SANT-like DNA-binding domain-containing protein 2 n=1 Tax=Astyanax mexicanus TaxID=7994 RepID=A0A8T2KVM5_ASTMX|nr:myb/SANT-like DNA-binding domain-containing protein 2 [Astyanax mexicanus]